MLSSLAILATAATVMLTAPADASATGTMWRLAISYNCNNTSVCGNTHDGVRGTFTLDESTATGSGHFAECNHDGQVGCGSIDEQISNWWAGPGSAGPLTIYIVGVDTATIRRKTSVVPFGPTGIGLPLIAGHFGATYRGFEFQAQISST